MPPASPSPRQRPLTLFAAFVFFEIVLIGFGVILGTGGQSLGGEMTKRLEAMSQPFQTISLLAVVACVAVTRARLNDRIVRNEQDLGREMMVCLAVGELAIILGLVGLAKLHLPEFLLSSGLALVVDFGFILPRSIHLVRALGDIKVQPTGNKKRR